MNNPDEILSAFVTSEVFGNLLLVEPRRDDLLCAVAASVREVTVCRSGKQAREDCRELDRLGCSAKAVKPKGLSALDSHSSLMIFDIPRGETPEEFLDLALAKVADDGFVLIDIELDSKSQLLRIQRILEASLGEFLPDTGWAEGDRFSVAGRRLANGRELVLEVPEEPLSLTVLCYVNDDSQAVDELAVSLLFRQSTLPALVIFLDDSRQEEGCLPDDLWGMAPQSPTQPALIRTGGVGPLAALKEGMAHVGTKYVIAIEAGQEPSPRWADQLCSALDARPEASLAIGGALEWDLDRETLVTRCLQVPDGECCNIFALILVASDTPLPLGAVLYRYDLLAALIDNCEDAELQVLAHDLLLQAAERSDTVHVPLPLLTYSSGVLEGSALKSVMERLHGRNAMPRLIDALSMLPENEREGIALEVRAEAALNAGAFDAALNDYQRALELDPDYPDLRVEYLVALRMAGREKDVVEQARTWWREDESNVQYALLLVWGLVASGEAERANALLLQLEREFPDDYRVLFDLIVLDENEKLSARGRHLIFLLKEKLIDDDLDQFCL